MSSEAPRDYITELVELHAKGKRDPRLVEVIDRFAWCFFHDPLEAPPGVQMTALERDLFILRACGGYEGVSDVELLVLHQMNPMLMASVTIEAALQDMFR